MLYNIDDRLKRVTEDLEELRGMKKRNIQLEALELKQKELNHKIEIEKERLQIYKTLSFPLHEHGTVGEVIELLRKLTPEQLDTVITELEREGE